MELLKNLALWIKATTIQLQNATSPVGRAFHEE
jgi:hypothetical protein